MWNTKYDTNGHVYKTETDSHWTFLQNRNRLTGIENRFVVAKVRGRDRL